MSHSLGLLYLASPTLPIGAFAYSQGLEKAIEIGSVKDRAELQSWCHDFMEFGLAELDLSMMLKLIDAATSANQEQFDRLDEQVMACRETSELLAEEKNLGRSMHRLISTQELDIESVKLADAPSFLASYVVAGISLELSRTEILIAFLWSWLENQTAVACKAIPLGQSDAQAILLALRPVILTLVDRAEHEHGARDADTSPLFGSCPGQVHMSALHETQYSRLFRS